MIMNILTKKECLHNLKILITRGGNEDEFLSLYPHFKYEIEYILELIDEYFEMVEQIESGRLSDGYHGNEAKK